MAARGTMVGAIRLEDVMPLAEFQARRPKLEPEILAQKALRRLHVGPHLTFLFENRRTCLWQVQEMCRVENITAPAAVQHEIDTYSALLPGPSELSATLLVEYDVATERDRMLVALQGLHDHVKLVIDGVPAAPARFDRAQFNEARISSVQFVRVPLTADQRTAFLDFAREARFEVDHPAYRAVERLSPSMRGALVEDLSG
jgi:hypothetical protein